MSDVLLTVGIPTYNRAEDLRLALDSVVAQVSDALRGRLEVFVSDNASTDATQQVVQEYQAKYPGLVAVHRNPSNLGFSKNVDAVVRYARGDFVLLLGDDDGLEDRALAEVVDIVSRNGDLGVIFLPEIPYDADLRAPLAGASDRKSCGEGTVYRPGLDYVRKNRIFPPFLVSGYVVRREAWLQACSADFLETICVHALTALRIMASYAAYAASVPAVRYRVENKGGNRWQDELYPFTFHLNLLVGCRGVRAQYPAELHRHLHRQAMRSIIYHVMELKASGGRLNKRLLSCRLDELADHGDPLYWMARLLLALPACWVRPLFGALMRARKRAQE